MIDRDPHGYGKGRTDGGTMNPHPFATNAILMLLLLLLRLLLLFRLVTIPTHYRVAAGSRGGSGMVVIVASHTW